MTPAAALLAVAALAAAPADDAADLWAAGRRADAVARLEADLAERPDDDALRLRLAERLLAVHRYDAAADVAAPLGEAGRRVRGPALYVLARYDQALPLLDRDDPDEILMVLDALTALGRIDDAEALLDHAADVRGADDAAVLVHRGQALARDGEHAAAVERFERALADDPLDAAALYGLGTSLVRSGRRDEGLARLAEHRALLPKLDALDFARRGLDLDPLHADNHGALGDALRDVGLVDDAAAAYGRGLELSADASSAVPIALRWARLLDEDHGDVDAAVALLDEVWTRWRDVRLPVRAGDLLTAAGRIDEALARYDAALAAVPGQAAILERRAAAEALR